MKPRGDLQRAQRAPRSLLAPLLAAAALSGCSWSDKVAMLAVPAEVDAEALTDAQLREKTFASRCVMFLAVDADDGLALVPHFRVRHSTTSSYLPRQASMSSPLHVSSWLIVDRRTLARPGLCLVLRAEPGAPWRKMPLPAATLRSAAATGRLLLPHLDTLAALE